MSDTRKGGEVIMAQARCPKCGEEGECEHEGGGQLHQGIFYDEYSFKCSKCGYTDSVVFPLDHARNRCPYCGKACGSPT
jgi:ribosomal protein S27AE